MSNKKIHTTSMSYEEAIEILKYLLEAMKVYDGVSPTQERINALQMAIDSLEVDEAYQLEYEQPEFCKDTLSRKELLQKWEETTPRGRTEFDQIIMSMPSVLPKVKKGHWIYHREEEYKCCEHWECSNCHKSTMANPMYGKNDYNHMYYCPKCGIKMESEVNNG